MSLPQTDTPRLEAIASQLVLWSPTPPRRGTGDPLRQLIFAMVSEGAAPSVGIAVFNRLRAHFPNWRALRDATPEALDSCLVGLKSAARLRQALPEVLFAIEQRCDELDLEHLSTLPTAAARDWLLALPHVSSTVADAVLAFSALSRPIFSIDQTAAQVLRRARLCDPGAPLSAMGAQLSLIAPAHWSSADYVAFADRLGQLGRRLCRDDRPRCEDCPIREKCPTGQDASAQIISFPSKRGRTSSGARAENSEAPKHQRDG